MSRRTPGARRGQARFHVLGDEELLDLLYTAGDRLPRAAADELVRRGSRVLPILAEIVGDKGAWTQPLPEWWAVVHATYILGAMESPDALVPLLTALRWADAFDCDWVTEDLPSIFGRLGPPAFEALRAVVQDPTAGPGARSIALASLGAIALARDYLREPATSLAASLLSDASQDLYLRQTAANVLVDLRAQGHRDLLVAFGREERARHKEDAEYQGVFYDWEVDDLLTQPEEAALEYYRRDWMSFYDADEMERRQERWAREQDEAQDQEAAARAPGPRDVRAPCPCGSGRPYAECCYLKMH